MKEGYHDIALIPGDLNGLTVTTAVREIAYASKHLLTKPVQFTTYPYNADYFLEKGITELGDEELGQLRQHDQIFLGAVGDPTKIKPGILEVGILLKVRQAFDQYVNLRPVVLPVGVPSVLAGKGHDEINFEICRENSEGLYCAKGRLENPGTDDEAGIQEMRCSYQGVKRLADYAAERAVLKGNEKGRKPVLHFVFKTNILTYAAVPWQRVFEEYKAQRQDLDVRYMHVDNFGMQMLLKPEQFDVVLTENMFGDIMTDIGAVLQGGIGSAVSGNINPTGEYPSMFEPIHGTAPDKWYGKDGEFDPELIRQIRPEAAFLAYAMLLEQIKENRAAEAIRFASLSNLREEGYKDMGLDLLVQEACNDVRMLH